MNNNKKKIWLCPVVSQISHNLLMFYINKHFAILMREEWNNSVHQEDLVMTLTR